MQHQLILNYVEIIRIAWNKNLYFHENYTKNIRYSWFIFCFNAFETFKFLVFLRISLYCSNVKEYILSGSILLLIITILNGICIYLLHLILWPPVFWKSILQLWLVSIFKLGTILTKTLLSTSATIIKKSLHFLTTQSISLVSFLQRPQIHQSLCSVLFISANWE